MEKIVMLVLLHKAWKKQRIDRREQGIWRLITPKRNDTIWWQKKQVGGRLVKILNPAHCYLKFECRNASVKDNNLKKKYFLLNWSKKITKNQTKHKPKIDLLCFSPFAKMEQKVNLKEEVTRQ